MLISHEVPVSLLDFSLKFNDYDYFLVHQVARYTEYRNFFLKSKMLNRRSILDNSLYELKESFDADAFADIIRDLSPSEYLIPDCFNDHNKNMDMFDNWMTLHGDLPGVMIATVHGRTLAEFKEAYRIFADAGVKIAFNFAEDIYTEMGNPVLSRFYVISSVGIDPSKKHHLLGCTAPQEFLMYKDMPFFETADTSNPIMAAFEGKRYPVFAKPMLTVDECHSIPITSRIEEDILHNTTVFRQYMGRT